MTSVGVIHELLRCHGPLTRGEIGQRSGLSRPTVTHRVERLLELGMAVEQDGRAKRGRPPGRLVWNPKAGVILAVDLDRTGARIAVTDLDASVQAESTIALDVTQGPERVFKRIVREGRSLVSRVDRAVTDIWGVGIGVPAPVDPATGTLIQPAGMPGWAGSSIVELVRDQLPVRVIVDNDVRMMAMGEARARWSHQSADFLFVKLGMGIGSAVVSDGRALRGAGGIAGELGHVNIDPSGPRCRCGSNGCLETVAAGWAILEKLSVSRIVDIVDLVEYYDPAALVAVRDAGRALGELLAVVVNVLNPGAVVIGGELAAAGEPILAGVRAMIHQRATPQAGGNIEISTSDLGPRAGVAGAAHAVLDAVLEPESIDALANGEPACAEGGESTRSGAVTGGPR